MRMGLGLCRPKERMVAYENGIGAIWAEAMMAARKKGDKMGIAWEKKYAEFKICVEMPKKGTKLYNWQMNQLSNTTGCLNAKNWEEITENKGSTIWSELRVKLSDCAEQKNCAKISSLNHITGCRREKPTL